ncbi:MAG: response regulator, partial [Ferrovibrionaceae bacterium]
QVYGFVKQTGGHVKIYSEVGQGTTVKIYLPRLLGEVEDDEDVESAAATTVHPVSELILVVEDDDDVRAHSVDIMTEIGYRVVQAQNGAAALDINDHRDDIALLFTDVGLPGGMNGRQLAEAAQARLPGLKVLFTTGYARNAIVHDGRLDPGVQLITKPFTYAALSAKVRDMLDIEAGASVILVVEDDPLVRMVMAETLAGLGARVEEAATATEAIAKARLLGSRLAAAIVDLGLPDRKGDGLAQELRAMQARLPIIVASGYGQGDLQARLGQDPLISFLPKPYDADQIATHLQRLGIAGLALAAP